MGSGTLVGSPLELINGCLMKGASMFRERVVGEDIPKIGILAFDTSPSLDATVTQAQPPLDDCTPAGSSGAFGVSLRPLVEGRPQVGP
jgi:hypothetical protein